MSTAQQKIWRACYAIAWDRTPEIVMTSWLHFANTQIQICTRLYIHREGYSFSSTELCFILYVLHTAILFIPVSRSYAFICIFFPVPELAISCLQVLSQERCVNRVTRTTQSRSTPLLYVEKLVLICILGKWKYFQNLHHL
jgi:hypothetical protein